VCIYTHTHCFVCVCIGIPNSLDSISSQDSQSFLPGIYTHTHTHTHTHMLLPRHTSLRSGPRMIPEAIHDSSNALPFPWSLTPIFLNRHSCVCVCIYIQSRNVCVCVCLHTRAFPHSISTIKSVESHDTQTSTWLFTGSPMSLDSIPSEHIYSVCVCVYVILTRHT
jgi:hypothetical protein